ncbi:MAG TPA: GTPase Era, partial [Oscillospiraceae bacterium]|nr:GTPase Era [Oscillospiraceae bacterium]
MIALVGRPNVGKSTLTNKLVGEKVAIVSSKPQTTRTRITAVVNHGDAQLVFLDTPGFHRPRSRLGDYMVKVASESVADVDAAVLVVEPIANIGAPEEGLLERIRAAGVPALLAINKMDTVKKEELLAVIDLYRKAFDFKAILPISARRSEGIGALVDELLKYAVPGPQLFPDGMVTDQPEKQILAEILREKLLLCLNKEIPHGTAVEINRYHTRKSGVVDLDMTIYCEKAGHKGIIIGAHGEMLKKISSLARQDMERFLG